MRDRYARESACHHIQTRRRRRRRRRRNRLGEALLGTLKFGMGLLGLRLGLPKAGGEGLLDAVSLLEGLGVGLVEGIDLPDQRGCAVRDRCGDLGGPRLSYRQTALQRMDLLPQ